MLDLTMIQIIQSMVSFMAGSQTARTHRTQALISPVLDIGMTVNHQTICAMTLLLVKQKASQPRILNGALVVYPTAYIWCIWCLAIRRPPIHSMGRMLMEWTPQQLLRAEE